MSDETPPPQLRLRPRKRDDEPSVVPPPPVIAPVSEPAPAEPASVAEAAPLRFRLKPKLAPVPPDSAAAEAALPVEPPPVVPAAPSTSAAGGGEMPRLKLKPQAVIEPSTLIGAPAPVLPPPIPTGVAPPPIPGAQPSAVVPPALPPSAMMPAFPVLQSPTAPSSMMIGGVSPAQPVAPPPLPMPPPFKAAPPAVVPAPYKVKKAASAKRSKTGLLVAGAVVLLLAAGAGSYFVFFAGQEPESVVEPTQRQSVPRVGGSSGPPLAPLPPPPTVLQPGSRNQAPVEPPPPLHPVVTPAFRSWVADVRVSGVRSSGAVVAIINGRVARPGDVVDAAEGIVFDGLDDQRKVLIFRSSVGAFLEKGY